MKKRIIAIDIDDTIADSTESIRLLTNRLHNVSLTTADYRIEDDYWGYYERVWEQHGLNGVASHDDFSAEMVNDQSTVPILPGAAFALKELSRRFVIILVTARDPSWAPATERWLKQHFDSDVDVSVYFCSSHIDPSAETKGQICQKLGAEWLVDDNVEHCMSAQREGITPILFGSYGWHHKASDDLLRCNDWPQVLDYFNGIK